MSSYHRDLCLRITSKPKSIIVQWADKTNEKSGQLLLLAPNFPGFIFNPKDNLTYNFKGGETKQKITKNLKKAVLDPYVKRSKN